MRRSTCFWLALPSFVLLGASAIADDAPGLKVPPGFKVTVFADETLANDTYAMTLDAKGRVVVTTRGEIKTLHDDDGNGRADRATLFARTETGGMGLCFDGNNLMFCGDGWLSRYVDQDGDGQADGPPEKILPLAFTEHGGHAMRKGPDGWWYVIGGNDSKITTEHAMLKTSPITRPEAGAILRMPPDFRGSEIVAHGFRNPYDFDFNVLGDLFTYDSDVERDVFLPWYFFTRVYHVAEGGHHGWRVTGYQRSWPRPTYDPGTVDVLDWVGRGSPTGVAVYRHDQFPDAYRGGLFILDWTFGKVFFLRLAQPGLGDDRSGYVASREVFLEPTGTSGFAPTDVVVAPDGSLLISIGGRRTRGSVYRVTYSGEANELAAMVEADLAPVESVLRARQPLDAWSRARWEPVARKLGKEPFRAAAKDGRRGVRERLRAIEVLTELFGGLDPELVTALSKDPSGYIRERTAWSLGRVATAGTIDDLRAFAYDAVPRVRLAALVALGNRMDSFTEGNVAGILTPSLNLDDKRTRSAAVNLAARLSEPRWLALRPSLRSSGVQARLAGLLAELERGPRDTLRTEVADEALAILDDTRKSREFQIQALRIIQRALGDWRLKDPAVEVLTAYSTQVPLNEYAALARRIRPIARSGFPAGLGPIVDDESARLLAMLEDDDPTVLRHASAFWTPTSSPTRDLHFLIVSACLRAPRDESLTRETARAIVALDKKLSGQEQRTKQSWNARLGETVRLLRERDPNLGRALVDEPGFIVPNHAALAAALEPTLRARAAKRFLKAAQADEDYAWSAELIDLLATLPDQDVRPAFRAQWPNFALRDALLPRLARAPEEADRPRFLDALDASLPDSIQTALTALESLPRDAAPEHLPPPLRLLRRLTLEPREHALRARVLKLVERQSGVSFAIQDDSTEILKIRQTYEPVFAWFARTHPTLSAQVLASAEDLPAWSKRIANVDWAAGDAVNGAKRFSERGCLTCHAGPRALGPDLKGVTNRLSRNDLFTAIIAPSLDVSPAYRTTLVESRDGQVFSGMIAFESADGLIIQTGATTTVRVANSDILSRHVGTRSLMPDQLLKDLDDQALADLYAYLRALK